MILDAVLKYKKAIVVDDDLLIQIEELIKQYFEQPIYSARLVNKDRIKFDNLNELLKYDNYASGKIESLRILFGDYGNITFSTTTFYDVFPNSAEVEFRFNNADRCEEFKRKIKNLLEKKKRSTWYTIVSKLSMMHFCFFIILLSGLSSVITSLSNSGLVMANSHILTALIIFMLGCVILIIIKGFLHKQYYPLTVFALGENKKQYEKNDALRDKFFWGIIINIAISVLSSYFFS